MRMRAMVAIPGLALVLVAALAGPAVGGGWATVELSSTPDGVRAGEEWMVDLTILQHGRTPLAGVQPAIRVSEPEGGRSERFVARATDRPGVYRARVTFPTAGEWEYRVDDGFGQVQTYPVVRIAEKPAPPVPAAEDAGAAAASRDSRAAVLTAAVALGVIAAGLTMVMLRRRGAGRRGGGAPAASSGR